jgi:hypothetical protein
MPTTVSLQLLGSIGPFLIVAAIALVVLAIRLYPPRDAGGRTLLALRTLSIALLLFLLLDPVLSLFTERTLPPRIALLLDGSLSMSIPSPAGSTRAQDMAGLLVGKEALLQHLRGKGRLDAFRFGGTATPLPADSAGSVQPTEDRTDLARSLADAVGADRRRTGAIVMISDGAENVGVDPREEARRLGVPVYTVGVGAEGPVTDLSVFDVEASDVSYLDNHVPVKAHVRARGDSASAVTVYLSEGDAVLDSARVDLPGGGVERDVDLAYVPTQEGLHRYRVWVPEVAGEISGTNNSHPFAVRVLKEKIRVLLVAARPSWDLTFLERALESDVSLAVETVILSLADFPGRLGRAGPKYPDAYADLAKNDLVVLEDAGGDALDAHRQADIVRFVRERGGALLVAGPPRAFDLAGAPLADLLPVVPTPGVRSRTGQILPELTPSGRSHPVTRLERDPELNHQLWSDLPPLGVAPVFPQLRPDARVLVEGSLRDGTHAELPLVAVRADGSGRILTIAGSPYWRWDLYLWGSGRSGDVFRRFVSRSVRWLVSRDDLKPVMIRPGKTLFEGAEKVVVEGQVFDDDYRPITGADVRATVRGPLGTMKEKAREISLVDLGEGRYRGSLPGLPPGDYGIDGTASLGGAELGTDHSEMTVAPFRMEFEDPAPNFELLREIARASGGQFLAADAAAGLPDLLHAEPVRDRSARELPFVESPFFFVALLGFLGSEWALRRRRGLP